MTSDADRRSASAADSHGATHAPTLFFVETSKSAYPGHQPTMPVTNAIDPITRNTRLTAPGLDMRLAVPG